MSRISSSRSGPAKTRCCTSALVPDAAAAMQRNESFKNRPTVLARQVQPDVEQIGILVKQTEAVDQLLSDLSIERRKIVSEPIDDCRYLFGICNLHREQRPLRKVCDADDQISPCKPGSDEALEQAHSAAHIPSLYETPRSLNGNDVMACDYGWTPLYPSAHTYRWNGHRCAHISPTCLPGKPGNKEHELVDCFGRLASSCPPEGSSW